MADTEMTSIFDIPPDAAFEAAADAAAEADFAAGRVVPHERVREWLQSWGTPDELPCPEPEPQGRTS